MKWTQILAFVILVGLLGSCVGTCWGVVLPTAPEYEYVYLEKKVTVPCPAQTPYPTLTPQVVTLDGIECPPCPTSVPSETLHLLDAVVVARPGGSEVDVYEAPSTFGSNTRRLGLLFEGDYVVIHDIRDGYAYCTFNAQWGISGWIHVRYLTTIQ